MVSGDHEVSSACAGPCWPASRRILGRLRPATASAAADCSAVRGARRRLDRMRQEDHHPLRQRLQRRHPGRHRFHLDRSAGQQSADGRISRRRRWCAPRLPGRRPKARNSTVSRPTAPISAASTRKGATFASAEMQRSNFTGAKLVNVDFTKAELGRADFTDATITGSQLRARQSRPRRFQQGKVQRRRSTSRTPSSS